MTTPQLGPEHSGCLPGRRGGCRFKCKNSQGSHQTDQLEIHLNVALYFKNNCVNLL